MTRPLLRTQPIEVTDSGHLIELLFDDGETDERLICAGHGGAVEPGTAELAIELATTMAETSCWATLGYEAEGSAFDSWHPPSTEIGPASYPLLGEISDRAFETVCSIHGLAEDAVIVGGAVASERKATVARELDDALSVEVTVANGGAYAGTNPENFVNWLARETGGLQLELGATARGAEATVVRRTLESLLSDEQ